MAAVDPLGAGPAWAGVWVAANSTSSQRANLFESLQTRPISSRVYRAINSAPRCEQPLLLLLPLTRKTLVMIRYFPPGRDQGWIFPSGSFGGKAPKRT